MEQNFSWDKRTRRSNQVDIPFLPVCVIFNRPVKIIYSIYVSNNYLYNSWVLLCFLFPNLDVTSLRIIGMTPYLCYSGEYLALIITEVAAVVCASRVLWNAISLFPRRIIHLVRWFVFPPSNPLEDSLVLMFLKREDEVNVKLQDWTRLDMFTLMLLQGWAQMSKTPACFKCVELKKQWPFYSVILLAH